MALPRLTGALRSFSNVTKQDDYSEESGDLMVKILSFISFVCLGLVVLISNLCCKSINSVSLR